ncbi:MAG: tetratricopeptide repeat protein [Betaproteobacteria bacterium]
MSVVALKLQRAIASYQQGQSRETDRLCREILQMDPRQCDALHLRGLAALRQGSVQAGIDLIARSLAVNPDQPMAHSNLGNAYLESNRPEQALAPFDRALRLDPDLPLALSGLGRALLVMGRNKEAAAILERAHRASPGDVETLHDRARALFQLGDMNGAIDALERALVLRPDSAGLFNDHGNALLEVGRTDDALASLDRALAVDPKFAEALSNHGLALLKLGRHDEALRSLDGALEFRPGFFAALSNRGNVHLQQKRFEDALADFDRALLAGANSPEAHNNRSAALLRLKRFEDALASADRALVFDALSPEALNNRGLALAGLFRYAEAEVVFNHAMQLAPTFVEVIQNLAQVLLKLNRLQDALVHFDRAIRLDPASASTHFNRGTVLLNTSRYDEAAAAFGDAMRLSSALPYVSGMALYANLNCGDWKGYHQRTEQIAEIAAGGGCAVDPLQAQLFLASPADQLACTRAYVDEHHPQPVVRMNASSKYRHDRIRIAYLSSDFREHPVAHVAAGLFERHDRDRFDTFAIALEAAPAGDRMRERLTRAFAHFHDASRLDDREVAAKLRELEIDIAVDLNGHTTGGRLGILAYRPAPVQVNYLGFPGTSGAGFIDYMVADARVIPPEEAHAYTESIVRLPHAYLPYDDTSPFAEIPSRSQAGLPEQGFVFCAFNSSFKINPAIFDVWMRILKRTPDSVLWLRSYNDAMQGNLRLEALARGVAAERLIFAPRTTTTAEHLARTQLADLFLDTLPYNAHSTAADALWAGLPVLTCAGNAFAGRVAASLLQSVGLPELITQNPEGYESLACSIAASPEMLADLRARLAINRQTHPLFDSDLYRRHLESAYITMWERNQRGEAPVGFSVQALVATCNRSPH